MKRSLIFGLMIAVVGLVVTIFVIDLRHDRKQVVEVFAQARLATTRQLAAELAARFASVRKDVLFFKYLIEQSAVSEATTAAFQSAAGRRFQREVQALLAIVPHYKEMHVIGPDGGVALRSAEPNWDPGPLRGRIERALAAAALRAPNLAEGRVAISAAIHGQRRGPEEPGYRIFSASVRLARGRRGAVLMLLEPDYLFGPLRSYRAPDNPHFALVNTRIGRVAFASSQALRRLEMELATGRAEAFAPVLRGQQAGRTELSPEMAGRLGHRDLALLTWAPLPPMDDWRWTLMVFSTAVHLEKRHEAILVRTVAAMAAVLAGLAALGTLLLRQVRREVELGERLRSAEEIRHLHEVSRKILDNVPSGLLALSEDLRVVQANRAILASSHSASLPGDLAAAFPAAAAADLARIRALVAGALERRAIASERFERVVLFEPKPGTYDLRAVPLDTPLHGVAVLLVIEDLTELQRLEQQLVRAEKLSTIGILSAGIAHEIGTPLGVVRARAEHLLEKATDEGARRSLQAIVEQADAISRIIRRVLEFTKTRGVQSAPVDLLAVGREAAELLRPRFEARKVHLDLAIDHVPPVVADADGLRQVLVNLLQNACDACQQGGRVELRAAREERGDGLYVRMEIRDNGCGIPREHLHSIFDPFFTTKKGGEGTGLGLAIAQDIVKNHGGTLSVESDPGRGSTFTILWPAAGEQWASTGGAS